MSIVEAVILGVLQGLTEFLPVSSSGHLTLAQHYLGFTEPDVFFDVVVHVATLMAVILYYRRDIGMMLEGLATPRLPGTRWWGLENWREQPGRWLIVLIVIGSIPTALIGGFGKDFFEAAFHSLWLVGVMYLITALLLVGTRFSFARATGRLNGVKAFFIGIAQGLAILPGISRSGTTIAVAMWLKVEPERAARYSFLLSIPAILGALALKIGDIPTAHEAFAPLAAGFASSFAVGYAALWGLIKLVRHGRLHWFALWCLAASAVAFIGAA